MAAVTSLVATPDTGATPNTSGSFTPTAGRLVVAGIITSGTVKDATDSLTGSANGLTFKQTGQAAFGAGAHTVSVYVAEQLTPASPVAMTVTFTPVDAGTGTVIFVGEVSGMSRHANTGAVRQWKAKENQSTGTPTVTLDSAPLTTNPLIGVLGLEGAGTANTAVEPSGWTELGDTGYATPSTGGEWCTVGSGFTSTTVTWTSATTTITGLIVVEFDTSTPPIDLVVANVAQAQTAEQPAPHTSTAVWWPRTKILVEGTGTRSFEPIDTIAGDRLVVAIGVENATAGETFTVSGGGLTWATPADSGAGGTSISRSIITTAPDAAGGSRTVQIAPSNAARKYTAWLGVARNHNGLGGSGATNTNQTVSVARQADNSSVIMVVVDWNAGSAASSTWTPGGTTQFAQQATGATYFIGRLAQAGTATTEAHGLSAPTLTTRSVAVVEIKATAAGANLTVANVAQAQSAGNIALTQVHNLTVAVVAQAQTAQNLALVQVHNLTIANVTQAQTAQNVALELPSQPINVRPVMVPMVSGRAFAMVMVTRVQPVPPVAAGPPTLSVANVAQAQTAGNVALVQQHVLTVANVAQAQTAGNISLTQVHNLTVQNVAQAQTTGNIALTQVHVLTTQNVAQAQAAGNIVLTQVHNLTMQNVAQAQTATTISLSGAGSLTVNNVAQAQTAGNIALTQVHVLAVQNVAQARTITSPAMTQVHVLTMQNVAQAQTATTISLSGAGSLTVNNVAQAQTAGNIALTQVHILVVQNVAQARTITSPAMTQLHQLVVQNVAQAQTAQNVSLSGAANLTVANVNQARTITSPAMTQVHVLAVQSATQTQTVGNVNLVQTHVLVVQNAAQAQSVPNVTITIGATPLTVANMSQARTIGNVVLTQVHVLTVQSVNQARTIGNVTLTQLHQLVVAAVLQPQSVPNVAISSGLLVTFREGSGTPQERGLGQVIETGSGAVVWANYTGEDDG